MRKMVVFVEVPEDQVATAEANIRWLFSPELARVVGEGWYVPGHPCIMIMKEEEEEEEEA